MGPWYALWLIVTLPQILEGKTPKRSGFSQLTSFEGEKFQGEWLVLSLAGNMYKREDWALLNPFITSFELKDSQLQMTNSMTRGKHCYIWSYTLIPTSKPGWFTVDHKGLGGDTEDIQIIETDYIKFTMMLSLRQTRSQTVTKVSLLGRSWRLPPNTIGRFICLTRMKNLTKNNFVFPDVTGNGFVGNGWWEKGMESGDPGQWWHLP